MSRRSPFTHAMSKTLVALLIATIVTSTLPPRAATPAVRNVLVAQALPIGPLPVAAADNLPADAVQAVEPEPALGILRFAAAVDADDNPASNPIAAAPVVRIGPAGAADPALDVRYAVMSPSTTRCWPCS